MIPSPRTRPSLGEARHRFDEPSQPAEEIGGASITPVTRRSRLLRDAALIMIPAGMMIALNLWFVLHDSFPPSEDGPARFIDALRFYRDFGRSGRLPLSSYPPFTFLSTVPAFALLGKNVLSGLVVIIGFSGLLVASVSWLGRIVAGPWGALLLGLAALGCPWFNLYTRNYLLDVPSAATVALAFAALIAGERFSRPLPTILFGIAAALGMLTRWTFLFFLLAPLVLVTIQLLRQSSERPLVLGTWAALALSTAVILWWILKHPFIPMAEWDALEGPAGQASSPPRVSVTWPIHLLAWSPWLVLGSLIGAGRFKRPLEAWTTHIAASVRRVWKSGRWSPGLGFFVAGALGTLGSIWWYLPNGSRVAWKLERQSTDFATHATGGDHLLIHLTTLSNATYLMFIWLALGIPISLCLRALRRPAFIALAATLTSVGFMVTLAPPAPRYVLPAIPFLLAIGFGWIGRIPYLRAMVLVLLTGLAALQTGVIPFDHLPRRLHPRLVDARPNPDWRGSWLSLPALRPPDPSWPDLRDALDQALRTTPAQGGWVQLGLLKHPNAGVEDRAFEMTAELHDLPIRFTYLHPPNSRPPSGIPAVLAILTHSTSRRWLNDNANWIESAKVQRCWRKSSTEYRRGQEYEGTYWCLLQMP